RRRRETDAEWLAFGRPCHPSATIHKTYGVSGMADNSGARAALSTRRQSCPGSSGTTAPGCASSASATSARSIRVMKRCRVAVRLAESDLAVLDAAIERGSFANRSDALRVG